MGLTANFIFAVAFVLNSVLTVYFWIVIISALMSWINPDPYNPIVRALRSLTEPVFQKIRSVIPFVMVGGLDLSPIAVLLGIKFLQIFLVQSLYQFAAGF
ncbi:YggT family protein [Desulfonatronum sp. SC1]|uniref:YggT family protein n=1 Tax=Desulfonatronum sp. SC1 TaxID=2109626 RepID=UPI000D2F8E2F|nr:YggT family protein [Desulfonatronum sp. SC1]PTN37651.1 YggT family protein [Desulfonatronum sp. SC1]